MAREQHGEARDAAQVLVEVGLALAQDPQQHVAGLALGRVGAKPLLPVHAAVREQQRRRGVVGLLGSSTEPLELEIENALPASDSAAEPTATTPSPLGPSSGREHAELVAAEPVGGAGRLHRGGQVLAQAAQQRIPGGMAEAVVVRLEPVEVEQREQRAGRSPSIASSRSSIRRRRLPSPVTGSDCDSRLLTASSVRWSENSSAIRTITTPSVAVAKPAANGFTGANWL